MDTQLQAIEVVNLDSLGHNFSPITNSIPNAMFSCNDNSNVYLPHQLSSTNSFELNAITSLSDDSGVPLTNSSTSSGDSCRLELCKLELELVESEGEVSQFDSLDNCSDGGMSAENFNTLKKGPLAPIDPPPEFQDSPQTTLVRSQLIQNFATKLSIQLLETAMTYYAYHTLLSSIEECSSNATNFFTNNSSHDTDLGGSIDIHKKHVYASDLTLNKSRENIYDEPNTEYNFSHDDKLQCGGKYPPIRRFEIGRQQDQESSKSQKIGWPYLSELHCYDFHYAVKKIGQYDSFQQKKAPVLYSPLQHHTANSTGNRPNSRNSINSRLSSSHNSLSLPHANKADDSIFITQAMSHDALIGREISDFYNVPIDSDIYAYPVDMINSDSNDLYKSKSLRQQKRHELKTAQYNKKKYRNNALESGETTDKSDYKLESMRSNEKRHSVPGSALRPMNMTLEEVKLFYHNLYSSSSESNETLNNKNKSHQQKHNKFFSKSRDILTDSKKSKVSSHQHTPAASIGSPGGGGGGLKNNISNIKKKKKIEKCGLKLSSSNTNNNNNNNNSSKPANQLKKSQFSINLNLKQKFCSIFRFRKSHHTSSNEQNLPTTGNYVSKCPTTTKNESNSNKKNFSTRALPPLPSRGRLRVILNENQRPEYNSAIHFASNIERVKNYGWYWGPISSEAAEKILSNEPDGSFIVRDSSDDHYIFSLSFKLNSCVRHVRIEQDQGTFSFGSYAKFKSQTITEFIEKAVEHSRSGRYLFFLHRRPEHGPMRVQLTNPVSRFKHIQSLQHMCRFVILKAVVRRDLIPTLPLPRRLQDYLSSKHCYSEQVESDSSQSQVSEDEGSSISSH